MPITRSKAGRAFSVAQHAAASRPALPSTSALCVPPELLTIIFSGLGAADLGRCACVAKPWRGVIAREPACWALAISELDPFCELGGPAGAERVARDAAGGCWLRAAALLTTHAPCDKCGDAGVVLCACNLKTRAAKAAMAANAHGRRRRRCAAHCASSPGCLELPSNRWRFESRPEDVTEMHGDGGAGSGDALVDAVVEAPANSTLRLTGDFQVFDVMYLWKPLRLRGGDGPGAARILLHNCTLSALAPVVILEGLTIEMLNDDVDCSADGNDTLLCEGIPAVEVLFGSRLIAERLSVNSELGAALLVDEGSAACLRGCTLSSCDQALGPQSLGVYALTDTTLAMYDCTVRRASHGLYAGADAGVLAQYNRFEDNKGEDVTYSYASEHVGQRVQPWHGAWAHQAAGS